MTTSLQHNNNNNNNYKKTLSYTIIYAFEPTAVGRTLLGALLCICTQVYTPEPKITRKIPVTPLSVAWLPQI